MKIPYVEPVLFIFALILYCNVPIEKQMIYRKVCLRRYINESFCDTIRFNPNNSAAENLLQKETAQWDMYNNIIRTIPTIFSTVFLGALSDGIGRKKILIVPVVGEVFNAISYFLNAWYMTAPVPFMFIGSFIAGICGNFPAMLMSVLAYISDVTMEETRTMRLVIADASVFLASIISLFVGSTLLMKYGFVAVYSFVMALAVVMLVLALFLKESYHPAEKISVRDVLCGKKIADSLKIFSVQRYENYHANILLLLSSFCFLFFVTTGISEIIILYLLHTPLSFLPSAIGYVLASESSVKFAGAFVVSALLVRKLQWQDSTLMIMCSLSAAAYGSCLGLSKTSTNVYLSTLWGFGK